MNTLAIRVCLQNEAILMTSAIAVIKRLWRVAAFAGSLLDRCSGGLRVAPSPNACEEVDALAAALRRLTGLSGSR
jgi:hypothetical protein